MTFRHDWSIRHKGSLFAWGRAHCRGVVGDTQKRTKMGGRTQAGLRRAGEWHSTHLGVEGNVGADQLAEQGRQSHANNIISRRCPRGRGQSHNGRPWGWRKCVSTRGRPRTGRDPVPKGQCAVSPGHRGSGGQARGAAWRSVTVGGSAQGRVTQARGGRRLAELGRAGIIKRASTEPKGLC